MNPSHPSRSLSILVKALIQLSTGRGLARINKLPKHPRGRLKVSRTPIVITHALSILKFNKVLIKKTKAKISLNFLRARTVGAWFIFNSFYSVPGERVPPTGDLKFWFIDKRGIASRACVSLRGNYKYDAVLRAKLCELTPRPARPVWTSLYYALLIVNHNRVLNETRHLFIIFILW